MRQQEFYHVANGSFRPGDWIEHGQFGRQVRLFGPGGLHPDHATFGTLLWEVALETARQGLAPEAVSRLDCLFACENLEFARTFRDTFRAGNAIYEVAPCKGTKLFRGAFGLITDKALTGSCMSFQPSIACRYWTEQPFNHVEVLIGGPVKVLSVIEAAHNFLLKLVFGKLSQEWNAKCRLPLCFKSCGGFCGSLIRMAEPTFTYTHHASEQIGLRELDRRWIERTVLAPDIVEPDPKHPDRMRAFRAVPERDGRMLRVAFVIQSALTYHIVTAFLDRGRRSEVREIPI